MILAAFDDFLRFSPSLDNSFSVVCAGRWKGGISECGWGCMELLTESPKALAVGSCSFMSQ